MRPRASVWPSPRGAAGGRGRRRRGAESRVTGPLTKYSTGVGACRHTNHVRAGARASGGFASFSRFRGVVFLYVVLRLIELFLLMLFKRIKMVEMILF